MSDRRYDDKETAAIFRIAAEGQPTPLQPASGDEGLTLADLQQVGREVGISADAVAQAAVTLDVRRGSSQRTLLGLPIGLERTVALDRRLTDDEWERLVVQCREVFHARGVTRSEGTLREWTNGNLQVLLEPTATGHRLRFTTLHGGAVASISAGLAALGVTSALIVATALSGTLGHAVLGVAFLGLVGVGMFANGALRLPRWARLRGRQMEALAAEVALLQAAPTEP